MKRLYGSLYRWAETGTEGVVWSVANPTLPGYDSLFCLEPGDRLTVFGPALEVIWAGRINLYYGSTQHSPEGFAVHGYQQGVDPLVWNQMFAEERRAIVEVIFSEKRLKAHPFDGPSAGMRDRLAEFITTRDAKKHWRDTVYPWLIFYTDVGWDSLARPWGFGVHEVAAMIGATPSQVEKWRVWPHAGDAVLMPMSLDRWEKLGLLFGVFGGLGWKFDGPRPLEGELKKLLMSDDLSEIGRLRDELLAEMYSVNPAEVS